MSIFVLWCVIAGILVCNYVIYLCLNYAEIEQLGKAEFKKQNHISSG